LINELIKERTLSCLLIEDVFWEIPVKNPLLKYRFPLLKDPITLD
jgi:hypothetical protein